MSPSGRWHRLCNAEYKHRGFESHLELMEQEIEFFTIKYSSESSLQDLDEILEMIHGRIAFTEEYRVGEFGMVTGALRQDQEVIIAIMYNGYEFGKTPEKWITFKFGIDADLKKFMGQLHISQEEHPHFQGLMQALTGLVAKKDEVVAE